MLKHLQLCDGKWWDGNVMQIKSQPNLHCTNARECEIAWHWHWSLIPISICTPSGSFSWSFSHNWRTHFLRVRDEKFRSTEVFPVLPIITWVSRAFRWMVSHMTPTCVGRHSQKLSWVRYFQEPNALGFSKNVTRLKFLEMAESWLKVTWLSAS